MKNKVILTLLALVLHFQFCYGQHSNNIVGNDSLKVNIEALNLNYKQSIKYPKRGEFRVLFFEYFPKDFESFNSTYGYVDGIGEMPLYDEYEHHINFFCQLDTIISDSIFYDKLVRIAFNSTWEADAINLYQDCLYDHCVKNPELIVSVLNHYSKKLIKSFCKFLFDGPHPSDVDVQRKFNKLYFDFGKIDSSISGILKEEYLKIKSDAKTDE